MTDIQAGKLLFAAVNKDPILFHAIFSNYRALRQKGVSVEEAYKDVTPKTDNDHEKSKS